MHSNILTETEKQILILAAQGLSNEKIGKKVFMSYHTVKSYLAKIFKKLNANGRTNAVHIAAKLGII